MNLRCIYCQTPFTIGRAEMLGAIITMNEKNQNHYDAHCPRCRRANSISRQRMELFYPNWKEDAAKQKAAAESAAAAPPPAPKAETPASAFLPTEPIEKPAAQKKPAASKKMTAAAKPAAKKPAAAKKTSAKTSAEKKPAASKTTTAAKKPAASKTTTSAKKPAAPKKK